MSAYATLLDDPIVLRLSAALVHFVWQGAALAVVALVLPLALRRARPAVRYLALLVVLAAMVAAPVATFVALPGAAGPAVVAPVASRTGAAPEFAVSAPAPAGGQAARAAGAGAADVSALSGSPAPTLASRLNQAGEWLDARLPWVAALWAVGVFVLSVRLLLGWIGLARARRRGTEPAGDRWQTVLVALAQRLRVSRPVRLLESAAAQVPTVIGWLRPVILLPTSALMGLTPEQIEALLAHELAHIRRHDYIVNLVQTVVETLLFYHPAVWWVSGRIRAEREHCCDDLAVACCGDALTYARALSEMEQLRSRAPQPALTAAGSSLLGRIRRLLGAAPPSRRSSWLAGALTIAVVVAVAGATYTAVAKAAAEPSVRVLLQVYYPTRFEFRTADAASDLLRLRAQIESTLLSPELPAPKVEVIAPDRLVVESSVSGEANFRTQAWQVAELLGAVAPGLHETGETMGEVTREQLHAVAEIIQRRARHLEPRARVEARPPREIIVSLTQVKDRRWAAETLSRPGRLAFAHVPRKYVPAMDRDPETGREGLWFTDRAGKRVPTEKVLAESRVIVRDGLKSSAYLEDRTPGARPTVTFEFQAEAGQKFYEFTRTHKGHYVAIVLDGEVISVPKVMAPIRHRGVIQGGFSESEAQALAIALNSSPLPLGVHVTSQQELATPHGEPQAVARTYFVYLRDGDVKEAKAFAAFQGEKAEHAWAKRAEEYARQLRAGGRKWYGRVGEVRKVPGPQGEWADVEVRWLFATNGGWGSGDPFVYRMRTVDGKWKLVVDSQSMENGIPYVSPEMAALAQARTGTRDVRVEQVSFSEVPVSVPYHHVRGLAVDGKGQIYLADSHMDVRAVLAFDPAGRLIRRIHVRDSDGVPLFVHDLSAGEKTIYALGVRNPWDKRASEFSVVEMDVASDYASRLVATLPIAEFGYPGQIAFCPPRTLYVLSPASEDESRRPHLIVGIDAVEGKVLGTTWAPLKGALACAPNGVLFALSGEGGLVSRKVWGEVPLSLRVSQPPRRADEPTPPSDWYSADIAASEALLAVAQNAPAPEAVTSGFARVVFCDYEGQYRGVLGPDAIASALPKAWRTSSGSFAEVVLRGSRLYMLYRDYYWGRGRAGLLILTFKMAGGAEGPGQPVRPPVTRGAPAATPEDEAKAAAHQYFLHLRAGEVARARELAVFEDEAAQREWLKQVRDYDQRREADNYRHMWWGVPFRVEMVPGRPHGRARVEMQWCYLTRNGWEMGALCTYSMRTVDGEWKMVVDKATTERGVLWVPAERP